LDPLSILALGGIAVCQLAVADGVDLGIGILFPLARNQDVRDQLLQGVTPFRRGNEPWLAFGAAVLCVVVPIACDGLPPALYMPVLAMFASLILRGVAIESLTGGASTKRIWTCAFAGGSFLAALCQGLILGACVEIALDRSGHFGSGVFDSLSVLGFLCAAVIGDGYVLLGIVFWYCTQVAAPTSAPVAGPMPDTMRVCPAGSRSSVSGYPAKFLPRDWPRHRRIAASSVECRAPHPTSMRSRGVPHFDRTFAPGE
jgi:cytochrome bd ubiquinol oxidase subunit II